MNDNLKERPTNTNDKKIIDLKNVIATKKSQLKTLKFTPITNCSIDFDGVRHNIHTLNSDALTFLLVKLNSYLLSMKNLNIKSLSISGYSIHNWITDIKSKLEIIAQQQEENTLSALESKLKSLLSEDKKTELELNSIETLLSSL
jgi:uncharacterized protein YdgA (DUF945 family)